ncbi:MAG: hypothetical protein JSV80_15100, partial [Acidobacteriota bacterium]
MAVLAGALAVPAFAGVVVYEKDGKKVEVGGRIQLQYRNIDGESDDSFDRVFFRRLRPYLAGTVTENWFGKIQFDFGESEDADEVQVKDAYLQFLGKKRHKLTIGNSKSVFSREFLTSSTKLQIIERGFAGSHNFGVPDRQMGIRYDGQNESRKVTWGAVLGAQHHDPAINRMDFDTPANNQSDWNQGLVIAARIDLHPLGYLKFDRGDFNSDEWRYNISA